MAISVRGGKEGKWEKREQAWTEAVTPHRVFSRTDGHR